MARTRSGSQFKHIGCQSTDDREGGEQHKSKEQHGLSAKDLAELSIGEEEAYYLSQAKIAFKEDNRGRYINIG